MKNNGELIEVIKSLVSNGHELTKKELDGVGVTPYNTKWLVENGYIRKVGPGVYEPEMIVKYDKRKENAAYYMFLNAFKNGDYDASKDFLYALYEISLDKDEVILLIALIDSLSKVDIEHSYIIDILKNKILGQGKIERAIDRQNFYKTCLLNLFNPAHYILSTLDRSEMFKFEEALRLLLMKNIEETKKTNSEIREYLKKDDILGLFDYMERKSELRRLSEKHEIIFYLTEVYKMMVETSLIPEVTKSKSENPSRYELIRNNDFEKALSSMDEYKKSIEGKLSKSTLYTLLEKVVHLKRQIKNDIVLDVPKNHRESDIQEIVWLNSDSTSSIDDIAKTYNMTVDDILMYQLLRAREAYKNGYKLSGDKLLKEVEKAPDKSLRVKSTLNEIRSRKSFYLNAKKYHTFK